MLVPADLVSGPAVWCVSEKVTRTPWIASVDCRLLRAWQPDLDRRRGPGRFRHLPAGR